jgi:predicted lipoprotein with Yx(FWY)xxD motif
MKALIGIAAALVAAMAFAACGGAGGGGSAVPAAAGGSSGSTVSVEQLGAAGSVLVDKSGQALYAADQEKGGMVLCTDSCVSFWQPLTVKGSPDAGSLPGKLGVVKRPDGGNQVTYNGQPLYSFAEDGPGEVTGDGFADAFGGQQFTWHVVHANGAQDSSGGSGTNTNSGPYCY